MQIKLTRRDIFSANNVIWFNHDGINYRLDTSEPMALMAWRGDEYIPLRRVTHVTLDNKTIMHYRLHFTDGTFLQLPSISNGKI